MNKTKTYIGDLFLSRNWYIVVGTVAVLFVVSYFVPLLFIPAEICTAIIFLLTVADYFLLFLSKGSLTVTRTMASRFSLGDENKVVISIVNNFPYGIKIEIIDELPEQFQERNFRIPLVLEYYGRKSIDYQLRPTSRGEYHFGSLICYVMSPLRLVKRRRIMEEPITIKVYPSFQHLRQFQLKALSDVSLTGEKKVRRLGHSLEFEKIKDYVQGDDMRTINWKATARTGNLMVNTYTDARQQQIYCIIDKGRSMKMPFEGLTLLDYSINAALALLNVSLLRYDKAGLITFSKKIDEIVAAERNSIQLNRLLEALYKQQTDFKESDYEVLVNIVHRRITQRSLILLFTNFETHASLKRQLPYLVRMASRHLVCVVFFQNTLLKEIHETQPDTIEGIYVKTIAEQFDYEKRQIVKELRVHGILSILTTPHDLTIDVINKYVELKARQMV